MIRRQPSTLGQTPPALGWILAATSESPLHMLGVDTGGGGPTMRQTASSRAVECPYAVFLSGASKSDAVTLPRTAETGKIVALTLPHYLLRNANVTRRWTRDGRSEERLGPISLLKGGASASRPDDDGRAPRSPAGLGLERVPWELVWPPVFGRKRASKQRTRASI